MTIRAVPPKGFPRRAVPPSRAAPATFPPHYIAGAARCPGTPLSGHGPFERRNAGPLPRGGHTGRSGQRRAGGAKPATIFYRLLRGGPARTLLCHFRGRYQPSHGYQSGA